MTAPAAEHTAMADQAMEHPAEERSGGRLVTADGRTLPLVGASLRARARGGLARVVLEQRFRNPFPEPLRVSYLFPLPHDAAVSGFAFTVGGRRVAGEIDRRDAARERFEEAVAAGRTAAIVDQERGSVFAQEVGNLPPGAELVAELTVDQRLGWLPAGAWEWRFPTAVAPRYAGAAGRVEDAARVAVDVADAPLPARLTLSVTIEDGLAEGRSPESPSHAVAFRPVPGGGVQAALAAEGGVPLDRDVVLRWPVAAPSPGLSLDPFRAAQGPLAGDAYALLTLVPPLAEARGPAFPRDLVVLLDTSGSMTGAPLDHARRVVSALVDGLRDEDTLELLEFSDAPRRWRKAPAKATAAARRDAVAWLGRLRAAGSTEMRDAIAEAFAGLRGDAQRQVLLVTDGHISFEREIVAEIARNLPARSRLHTLGVGESVNRSLLAAAARAGRGTESIVGLAEDVERALGTIAARMEAPLVSEVAVAGDALVEHAPARLPDLYGGAPALFALRLRPGGGTLRVSGRVPGGAFERTVTVPVIEAGTGDPAVAALFGREAVEDLELRLAAGGSGSTIDPRVERLGLDHQIATRLTSWIAVSEEPGVDPTQPTRRVVVPQELPRGMSVEGLGLRLARAAAQPMTTTMRPRSASPAPARSEGLVARLARFAFPGPAREPAEPQKVGGAAEEGRGGGDAGEAVAPAPPAGARRLTARVLLDAHGRVILEVDVDVPLDWAPPAEVTLVLADGSASTARVVPESTTRAGAIAGGTKLRLALALVAEAPPLAAPIVRVEVVSGRLALSLAVPPRRSR